MFKGVDKLMNDNYQLLANPHHLKKKKIEDSDLDSRLFLLLSKKFPENKINKKDYTTILKKIEFILVENTIHNTVQDTIDSIINYVLDEQLL